MQPEVGCEVTGDSGSMHRCQHLSVWNPLFRLPSKSRLCTLSQGMQKHIHCLIKVFRPPKPVRPWSRMGHNTPIMARYTNTNCRAHRCENGAWYLFGLTVPTLLGTASPPTRDSTCAFMASSSMYIPVDWPKGFNYAADYDLDSNCDQGGATAPSRRCSFPPRRSCIQVALRALRRGSGAAHRLLALLCLQCPSCCRNGDINGSCSRRPRPGCSLYKTSHAPELPYTI